MSDDGLAALAPERIAALLATRRYGRSLDVLAETHSTNDDARAAARRGAVPGHTVVANAQRGGRGSNGRAWSSPAGTDLYVSVVDQPQVALAQLPPLTLAVGLGVSDAVIAVLGHDAPVSVKWPNDVWVGEHKCAGVLLEATSAGDQVQTLVIGIGLNVNRLEFPPGLDHPATSLRLQTGRPHDRGEVLAGLLASVECWVERFEQAGAAPVVEALTERLSLRGQAVACGDVRGTLLGIAPDGALRVATPAGEQRCVAGRLQRLAGE